MSRRKGQLSNGFQTSWLDAKLDAVARDRFAFRGFMIVSVVAALVWVGFVASATLRTAPTPLQNVAALPPLGLPALPAPANSSDSSGQTTNFGLFPNAEPTPADSDASQLPSGNAPAPASTAIHAAPARKATGSNDGAAKPVAAPARPAPTPVTMTVRTFHPPVIPSMYKDMVADKMKEDGFNPRLEAKIRSGQQLSKGDLASVPKAVMERLNKEVVAYGQPPLYTDTTTTTVASSAH